MSSQKQIYLIDDDQSIRDSITLVLSESGYQVFPFGKWENLIATFRKY